MQGLAASPAIAAAIRLHTPERANPGDVRSVFGVGNQNFARHLVSAAVMPIASEEIEQALREYAGVVPSLRASIAGLSGEQLTARPGPGDWSVHEVVIHTVDSDIVAWDRMKRIAAMERPTLIPYDETAFAKRLFYHEQSLEDALALFEIGRRQMSRILERLPREAFERKGLHTDDGELSLLDFVRRYAQHVEHHVRFIDAKRERMRVPRAS